MSPAQASTTLIGHRFSQGSIADVMDRSTVHGRATVREPSIGKEATIVRRGAGIELTITRVAAMHRHAVDDFEHFRPSDRILWHHGPTNRHQNGTIIAWSPKYFVNAVGEIVCIEARAVIQVNHLTFGMGLGKDDVQVAETFRRYGSGIVMVYR